MTEAEQQLILAKNEILQTERFILRKIILADSQDIFDYWGDEEVVQNTGTTKKNSIEEVEQMIAKWMIPNQLIIWGIEDRVSQKIIGHIEIHINGDQGELGWMLNHKFWGKGVMPEVATCLRNFAFEKLKLLVLTASTFVENRKSKRVMEKIGMTYLGKFYVSIREVSFLSDYYAITRKDFEKIKEK
ncbi:GNAT family N-acetyltransferase [Lactococcus nasutitermitis]|uniref:GNAT family N-acetyltransferase n=1 Tax=Lactococcus nasutitermitis TaxID=1652957 RepID=A0ABV9JF92_9LACT|nr:GNAT family N-acetyltransferase [Lactococcus nasutitermitis]